MGDARIYRAAFLPALLAVVLAMFSLGAQPAGRSSPLAPDAFDGVRAARVYEDFIRALPDRQPGSAGDMRAADLVEKRLKKLGFEVSRQQFAGRYGGRDVRMQNILGVLPGSSDRRVLLVAHRDGVAGRSQADGGAPTAVLLELANVLRRLAHHKTIIVISTDGGTAGAAGARHLADGDLPQGAGVDGILVLDRIVGENLRSPHVLPWGAAPRLSPLALVRTTQKAMRDEFGGVVAGGWPAQLIRQAVPVTLTEQGPFVAAELPAIALTVQGEVPGGTGPVPDPQAESKLQGIGKAALATTLAVDSDEGFRPVARTYLTVFGQVLPGWVVRVLVIAFLLPVLLVGIDSVPRVRRRREHLGSAVLWVGEAAIPFFVTLAYAYVFDLIGFLPEAPSYPFAPNAFELGVEGALALVVLLLVFALSWIAVRRFVRRGFNRVLREATPGIAPASALTLILGLEVLAVWFLNPFAAALFVPAAHLWMLATLPEGVRPLPLSLTLLVLGLGPPLLVLIYYAGVLETGTGVLYYSVLLVAGGFTSLWTDVWLCMIGATFVSALAICLAKRGSRRGESPITTRGPHTYAGPGSLGGTESALKRPQ